MNPHSSDPPPGVGAYDTETKTSIAAVLGFVVSLIGCCLPTGLLGAVLGVFGLIGIGRSGGRVGGKGLAIAAIIIGVLSTLVQIGMVVAALAWGRSVGQFGARSGEFVSLAESGDYGGARAMLAGNLANVDDATLAAFALDVTDDVGSFVSPPDSLGSLFSGLFFEFGPLLSQNQLPRSVPVVVQFDNERALVQYTMHTGGASGGLPAMEDLQITTLDGVNYRLSDYARGLRATVTLPAPTTDPSTPADDATPADPASPADAGDAGGPPDDGG